MQQNALSVSLVGGKVVAMFVLEGRRYTLQTTVENLNDGFWHYIVVTKVAREYVSCCTVQFFGM